MVLDFYLGEANQKILQAVGIARTNLAGAISLISRAIYLVPDEPSFYLLRAECYLDASDFESAIGNFRQALQLIGPFQVSGDPARLAASLGEEESRATSASAAAPGTLANQKGRWINTKLRRVLFTWGQILLDEFRFVEALECFQQCTTLGMAFESTAMRMVAAYLGLQNYDEALELLYKQSEANPADDGTTCYLRAKVFQLLEQHDFMNIDLVRAERLCAVGADAEIPELPALREHVLKVACELKNRGCRQMKLGNIERAIYLFGQAVELDPLDHVSFFHRGVLFLSLGQIDNATADLQVAVEGAEAESLLKAEAAFYLSKAYNVLGIQLLGSDRFAEAKEAFSAALDYCDFQPNIYKNRSECNIKLGQVGKALQDLEAALKLRPDEVATRDRLCQLLCGIGRRLAARGDLRGALAELDRAVAAAPADTALRVERARLRLLADDVDGARRDLDDSAATAAGRGDGGGGGGGGDAALLAAAVAPSPPPPCSLGALPPGKKVRGLLRAAARWRCPLHDNPKYLGDLGHAFMEK
ncbi:Tetratricopeptide repeat protein 16 [Cladochytrium tenue]|nr:Tetratricopeptide repeat protein 16 [Cladochytrium tenue]